MVESQTTVAALLLVVNGTSYWASWANAIELTASGRSGVLLEDCGPRRRSAMTARNNAPRTSAVVVGSVNADLVVHTERAPDAGETVRGVRFDVFPGGKGANQAAALGRLGAAVALAGLTGADSFAAMLRAELLAAHVNCAALGTVDGPTGVALITTELSGENRIVVVPGANGQVTPETVDRHRELIERASVLLLQLELPLGTVLRAAEIASAAGTAVILDPAPAQALPAELLQRTTWLTPNQTEAGVLLGRTVDADSEEDLTHAAEELLARGARNVVLKLGSRGCFAATNDGSRLRLQAFRVSALDTTAAGDAFNGGFAAALLRDLPLRAALREASATAALSVTRKGALPSLPTRKEVDDFLAANELAE